MTQSDNTLLLVINLSTARLSDGLSLLLDEELDPDVSMDPLLITS